MKKDLAFPNINLVLFHDIGEYRIINWYQEYLFML